MRVEPLTPAWEERWDAFVRGHPGGLFYSSLGYRDLLVELLGCEAPYLVAVEGDELRGLLPLMRAQGPHGPVLNSLPYYGSNGGALARDAEAAAALTAAWDELARDSAAATVVENPFLDEQPPGPEHAIEDERIVQFTELTADDSDRDHLLARVDGSARRNVRKAEREGITVEIDNTAFPRLYEIHEQNITAIGGLPKSPRFFELVPRLVPAGDYELWVARREGEIVAGLLTFLCSKTVEYFTPATEHGARPLQPLAAILAEALPAAARRGYTAWNWGGTWLSQESLYRFKRKWAASERRYRYFTQVNEQALLRLSPGELRDAYPNFFVAPYSVLAGVPA